MAHFAILCPEAGGHLFPMGSVGVELRRRGHNVTLVARDKATPIAEQLGLPLHEISTEDGPKYRPPPRLLLGAAALAGLAPYVGLRARFCYRADFLLAKAPAVLRELAIDGLLVDQTILAGGTIADRLDIPYVSICSAMHWNGEQDVPPHYTGWPYGEGRWYRRRNALAYAAWARYVRPALNVVNRYRRSWSLPALSGFEGIYSPLAEIAQTCAEFDFPRSELPETFHYCGALAAERPVSDDRFPWDRLDGRPLIYASMGTVRPNRNEKVFQKIAAACEGLEAQLVISAGKWADEGEGADGELSDLPGDPLVVEFAPQLALLARAELLITHAGQNTVVEALNHAVPMVALPRGADQPALAARIKHAGVGLSASFFRFRAGELRTLVKRVLNDPTFRQEAVRLQQRMAAAGGAERAAEIAERALTTARPVTRSEFPVGQSSLSRT